MHELASCFCPYRLYPHDTLCTYGVKQLRLRVFLYIPMLSGFLCVVISDAFAIPERTLARIIASSNWPSKRLVLLAA